jgi:hypothetical protein
MGPQEVVEPDEVKLTCGVFPTVTFCVTLAVHPALLVTVSTTTNVPDVA